MIDTLPKSLSPSLLAFCQELSSHRPIFVASKPAADAVQSFCFENVARKVERSGGSIAYGWAIWSVPDLYFEAEHHGIWRNPKGKLVDVSPQLNGCRKIVFLPDPEAIYDPWSIRSNILKPIGNDPLAAEFVEIANARNALIDKYRIGGVSAASLSWIDELKQNDLDQRLLDVWAMLGREMA